MWCTYLINSAKEHLVFVTEHSAISCQSTWFLNLVHGKFIMVKEDADQQASTHLPSTQGLLTRIGTQDTTPHSFRSPQEGSAMTRPTIQKILENHGVLPKA
jgi:hypothetical protein